MIRTRDILLALGLSSSKATAQIAVDLNYGHSFGGSFQSGKTASLQQQSFGLTADMIKPLKRGLLSRLQNKPPQSERDSKAAADKGTDTPPAADIAGEPQSPSESLGTWEKSLSLLHALLRTGEENFSLGAGLYTAQVRYQAGGISSSGTNIFLTVRGGWVLFLEQKAWLLQLTPELILVSRLSAASYSVATVGTESVASSTVSTFSGFGLLSLPISLSKKLRWQALGRDLYAGGSLSYLMQDFSEREDTTAATSPSTGAVNKIAKSASGNYPLRALTIGLHLTVLL